MKTILFYDTETTGLPEWSKPSEDPCQPRVTQLAAELCIEETGETIAELNHIILPDGWTIPADVAAMTGLTTELALIEGVAADLVIHEFIEMWNRAGLRSAHNEQFDMRMLRIELVRHQVFRAQLVNGVPFADHWKAGPAFCTQGKATKIVNDARPAGDKKKTCTLGEAYAHFTGKTLEGAHNAKVDVMACKAVYYGIKAAVGAPVQRRGGAAMHERKLIRIDGTEQVIEQPVSIKQGRGADQRQLPR
jgi:DNA polymerase-3 subunit epsilon